MFAQQTARAAALTSVCLLFLLSITHLVEADEPPMTQEEFRLLQKQNEQLLQRLDAQQSVINALSNQVSEIKSARSASSPDGGNAAKEPETGSATSSFGPGKIHLSGEAAAGFFRSGVNGPYSHSAFRIDEARLYLDAPVWGDIYFYSEVDLATRESTSLGLNVGELYIDFENVSQLWNTDRMLNVRAGHFYIPFGEEYLERFAIKNPLISHSVSDFWGSDDGVELYGDVGPVKYAVAVQNGGGQTLQTLQDDKSVAGRVSYDPVRWLHLSGSAMRTGNLSVNNGVSAMWFGNGFFRSIGSSKTTCFHANVVEGDVQINLPYVRLKASGGYIDYGDNDPTANNHRDVYYYSLEGVHDFNRHLYAAGRFSEVFANRGFPIVGGGTMGQYGFGDLTSEYWRLSLGMGWRFSPHALVKAEYSFNHGKEPNGEVRAGENVISLEAAVEF